MLYCKPSLFRIGTTWVCHWLAAGALLLAAGAAGANARSANEALDKKDYRKAHQECAAAAAAGDKDCQATLGYLYKTGLGVDIQHAVAIEWLNKAVAQGQPDAAITLGDSYRRGLGVAVNYAEALRLFKMGIDKGLAYANTHLGYLSRFGQGVPKDAREAFRLFKVAAEKGHAAGQTSLADLYRLGEGTDRNPDEAFQWALKASKQDYAPGHNVLGLLFRDGVGVRQDSQRAIELFKQAAESKTVPVAYANLASMFYDGRGVPVNLDEAAKWAEIGAQSNEANCMAMLAGIYRRGSKQVRANPALAFEWASKAAALNNSAGLNQLGILYRDGIGTAADAAKALAMFQRAANAGAGEAHFNLAAMSEKGLGLPKDDQLAMQGYERALASPFLAPGTRSAAEAALARLRTANPGAGSAQVAVRPPAAVAAPAAAPGAADDREVSRAELMEKLNLMQKQLAALQASSNTAAADSAASKQQVVYANRRALLIGNDNYRFVPKLNNAVFDAQSMARALEGVGYKVSLHVNLDEKGLKQALRDFKLLVQGGDEVLVFFSGHGVQLGSANYLLPVDIKGDNEEQVRDESIQLQRILDDLHDRKAKFSLAIIDACRDNPFKGHGRAIGGRGLAPTTAATGQMVMFSAGSGQQALDRLGSNDRERNGLFTRVLLKEMAKPGVTVDRILRNVRNDVVNMAKSVGHEQTPALYDQAVGDFYFVK